MKIENVKAYEIKFALSKKHEERKDFFMLECKNGPTHFGSHLRFDALAIVKSWANPCFIGYEVKVSRSDFLADSKWPGYLPYVHEFSFVVPSGLVDKDELDPQVGLIYYNPKTHSLTTRRKAVHRLIEPDPSMLLYIVMNRIDSDRMPFDLHKTDMFQAWLDEKQTTRELSYKVKGKLVQENARLLERISELETNERWKERYEELVKVMRKHGLRPRLGEASECLDTALAQKVSRAGFDDLQEQAESLLRKIKTMGVTR